MSKDLQQKHAVVGTNGNHSAGSVNAQTAVAQVWAEVLQREDISADANFFDLGGDSLKALEVISRLQTALNVELPLIVFFEDPTIHHLAQVVDELRGETATPAGEAESTQAAVMSVWAEVLERENIAPTENFFEIGGDSLKALEVISRLQALVGVELPLITFFEEPTIAHCSEIIDQLQAEVAGSPVAPVAAGANGPVPASFPQLTFWLLQQSDAAGFLYNEPRVLRIRGKLEKDALQKAFDILGRRHEALRTRLVAEGEEPVQVIDTEPTLRLAFQDLSGVQPAAAEKQAMAIAGEESRRAFDLAKEVPIRARLLKLGKEDHQLIVVIHHVLSDGHTCAIFFDELSQAYDSIASGKKLELPGNVPQYREFASWERSQSQGARLEDGLDYWRLQLKDALPKLDLPTDNAPGEGSDYHGASRSVVISPALLQKLKSLAQANSTTLFTALSAGLRLLLSRWTRQEDVVIGTVVSNRSFAGSDRMLGCFLNFLPLRNRVSGGETALDVLSREKRVVLDAFAHACPFVKIAETVASQREAQSEPVYNVALLLQNFPAMKFAGHSFNAEFLEQEVETALLDLRFIAQEVADGLKVDCDFKTHLFTPETISQLLEAYVSTLTSLAAETQLRVEHFEIPKKLREQAEAARRRNRKRTVAIASTFTAEPVAESLFFWMRELEIPSEIKFAAYDQVFQELLDPASLISRNSDGFNLLLLRLSDWLGSHTSDTARRKNVEKIIGELIAALQGSKPLSPCIVCICPPERKYTGEPEWAGFWQSCESRIAEELSTVPNVHVIGSQQILDRYPVANYQDEYADTVGRIPYTSEFFVAVSTMVARRIAALRSAPKKVIVLDCDNTLWKGVCGEDGPMGVRVDAAQRKLQEFMLGQLKAGMLLCLCSKNTEEDVDAVFAQNPGMVLRPEHVAARRINWNAKSQNLRELASGLELGLDSFVFIDDNPIECAEVEGECPEVLTLRLPENDAEIAGFLGGVWAFDHWRVTSEDAQRTAMYRQNAERDVVRKQSATLDDFIAGLELKLEIQPMEAADLPRVSQLTERTNQFNFTTIRRSEAEVREFLQAGGECLTVRLSDRFGDYGLVGVVMFTGAKKSLTVDTMLLSCRALGRKVEHRMLARLGEIAHERNLSQVCVTLLPTRKNQPALDFINHVASPFRSTLPEGFRYDIPAQYATEVAQMQLAGATQEAEREVKAGGAPVNDVARQNKRLARIALEWNNVGSVVRAINAERSARAEDAAFVAPRNPVEELLAGIWAQVLKLERVSVHDNFFALGGHSLMATQVVARLRQVLGIELPLRAMFESPTVEQLAQKVADQTGAAVQAPPITRVRDRENLPLSFAQQRLWFLDQLDPGNPLYNMAQMMRLRGELNVDGLRQSLNRMFERHEVLRTTFATHNGEPVQVIAGEMRCELPLTDLAAMPAEKREQELQRLTQAEAQRPFDLATGPLMRAQLLRIAEKDHVLLLTMHHIVSDRWTLGLVAEEITAQYRALTEQRSAALRELTVQYADFAVWQRNWLQGDVLREQLDHWKKQLAGAPEALQFPTDYSRPAQMSMAGALHSRVLPRELVRKLEFLSQEQGVTLFMTLLAAFQVLLARYSGQEDVVVGSPIAGRKYAEVEPLIGFFVNTLALRGDLAGDPSFSELLKRTKEVCLQAYGAQDVPFEKLVEELQPERSLNRNPIFQVLFALQNAPMQTLQLPGLELERTAVHPGTSILDMSWFAIEVPEGMLLRVEYSTELFQADSIDRALEHFATLLESVITDPRQHVSRLGLLGEVERRQLLVEFNANEAEFAPGLCLQTIFERSVARTPDATALVCGNQRLSYAELNERANQIAHYLIQLGTRPAELVGVFMERTPDLLAAILGVLKSGAAYVPLDPSYPKDRLAAILEDAKSTVVLTQQSLVEQLGTTQTRVVAIDRQWQEIEKESRNNPDVNPQPNSLGYVLFTSGSTGRPKGVAIEHRSAVTLVQWAQTVYTPEELAGVLLSTSVCFDLSIFEIFVPLSVGGKIIVVQNALYLPSAEAKDEVTLINTVPSAMAELTRMRAVPSSVKVVNLAGEALPQSLVDDIYSTTSASKVFNLYGPTEDTTYSTYTLTHAGEKVTIGKALPNSQAYILDKNLNPVPVGVPGELYLAGAGLARGYFGRDDLTAERFIANPFSKGKNSRMYKTGDLCRWLANGEIEYLGRIDHQVKLRGFRIELGEIESVLGKFNGVRQCLVVAREDDPGIKQLVAYVVADEANSVSSAALVAHLKQSLPEFMIPAAFVVLKAFPLTPNGKIDRKALPKPEREQQPETYVTPRTPMEEIVAGIWAQVLRVPRVGVHDDFFSLGGHSLLATQVISRVRQVCNVEIPLRALFEAPTVGGLAAVIEKLSKDDSATKAPPMVRVSREQELPLSFAQQRLWFLDQLEPDNPFYNVPQGLRMHGELNRDALEKSLTEIVRRHEVLRTTYRMVDGRAMQFISPTPTLNVQSIDLIHLPEAEREREARRFAAEEARRPFRIDQGPVMRAYLLQLDKNEHILILNTHHIASDGWSMGIYVREFGELYSAFVEGKPSPLPELPIQYSDFALWQRNWIEGDTLERHMAYWRKQLEGASTTLELPSDRPRPTMQTFRGETRSLRLPVELLNGLKELSQREGATLYMTLLAAFQALLYRYTGQEDIVVGSPIANRNHAEIENLIGFFVNALTMRTNLSGSPSFRQLLGRVREVALEAYAHQDLPFEKLVEEFDPERSLGHNPLFQVLFVLQNAPKYKLDLPGLKLEWLEVYSGTAKFDIALHVAERADGLNCMMEFNTDLFDPATIMRMLGHLQTMLDAIVVNPDQPIAQIPILTAAERQKLLVEFNHAGASFAPQQCIHQRVEAQAERTPDHVALVFENQRLTYCELNQRANQLAHFLRKNGVGPETLVGMCMDRSLEMVVGIVGILKAGGAYLPFDIAYPPERLAFMIEDAKPAIVLTQERLKDQLPSHGARIVCMDTDWPSIAGESTNNPNSGVATDNLAYVIYTSGSTGKPKGCQVTHYNVVRLMQATQDWYGFDENDVWTMFHSYAFDFSVWELWGALFYGGRVVVVPYLVSRSPEEFYKLLSDEGVTVLNQTPSSFRQLIQAEERVGQHKLKLRYVIFGGEALNMQSLKPWFERHGDQTPKLINMYGITETTVHVTYRPLSVSDTDGGSVIGQSIPDLQLYILDPQRQPLPIGIPGEMYVGGAGVARGYLNRPELTQERFIADPFSSRPGARLYKTGDLARYLDNGDIEYLGRIDHQVKIRGFRIELGEIESVISEHPAVRNSVVLVREDEPGNQQLVAYVVANKQYQGETEESQATASLKEEQVSQWEMTFDETYSQGSDEDPEFNIIGWNSSYTGQPYPAEHMREWVDYTVERIRDLKPKRLLEIGCGTGLLLLRIAPDCDKYLATDFSQKAISRLERITRERGMSQVSLSARMGDNFAGVEPNAFDTAVINSVIQYFPSIDYFMTVLQGMIEAVAPGGTIFIGDIRSLSLLEAFHTAVQLQQAPGSLSTDQFAQRIRQGVAQDEELVIDPALFHELKRREPKIGRVEIQIKRGRHRNEMTQFRYDAVLHIGAGTHVAADCSWIDWRKQNLNVPRIGEILRETTPDVLGITGIPNARVAEEVTTRQLLARGKRPSDVDQLKSAIRQEIVGAIEPEDIWALADSLGYSADINWSLSGNSSMDVILRRKSGSAASSPVASLRQQQDAAAKPWSYYANNPLAGKIVRNLVPQLRNRASEKLPEYMVPSAFVVLDSLPLTENGKVDRKALPAPDQLRPELEGNYVAPRTPAEELIAGIWAEVLKLERVGIHDDFFDLGGHSLNATQVVSRVREAFQIEMPLRAIFESPTVEKLASSIAAWKRHDIGSDMPPMLAVARDRQLLLSFAQQRLWFLDQLDPGNWLYNVPRAIRLKGEFHADAMRKAVNELIARHEILRTTYRMEGDHAVQVIAPELKIDLPLVDLAGVAADKKEAEAQRIVQEQSAKGFNLSTDAMLRGCVLRLGERDHVLFINTHHIASDGWSTGVMMNELAAFYEAALRGESANLPELKIQYADYAAWQREWLQGEVLNKQLDFWRHTLDGAPAVLSLPTDRPRPAVQSFGGAVYESAIPKALAEAIRQLGRQNGSTTFMTMLAAFKSLLLHYTGQQDLVLGTDLANRPTVETEALIGFFVNLLVVRTNLSGNPTFEEALGRVREVMLKAYAHQDLPFDKLVEELRPERNLSHSPLVQVLFVQQNTPRASTSMPGLELGRFPLQVPSKFDMAVFMNEADGGLLGRWVYNPDLFDATTIVRMAANYEQVLSSVTLDPRMRLTAISEIVQDVEKQLRGSEQKKLEEAGRDRLKKARRKAIEV